jgi:hypothetical protein
VAFFVDRPAHDLTIAAGGLARIGAVKSTGTARLGGLRGGACIVQRAAKRFGCRVDAGIGRAGQVDDPGQEQRGRCHFQGALQKISARQQVHGSDPPKTVAFEAHSLAIRPGPCKPGRRMARRARSPATPTVRRRFMLVRCSRPTKKGRDIQLRTARSASLGSRTRNKVTQPAGFNIAPGAASG